MGLLVFLSILQGVYHEIVWRRQFVATVICFFWWREGALSAIPLFHPAVRNSDPLMAILECPLWVRGSRVPLAPCCEGALVVRP